VVIEWENGEITIEPLQVNAKDNTNTCAIYEKENEILETDGWIGPSQLQSVKTGSLVGSISQSRRILGQISPHRSTKMVR
jgi:hypothetical protein